MCVTKRCVYPLFQPYGRQVQQQQQVVNAMLQQLPQQQRGQIEQVDWLFFV